MQVPTASGGHTSPQVPCFRDQLLGPMANIITNLIVIIITSVH